MAQRNQIQRRTKSRKPYAMVGAGNLTAAIWKRGNAASKFQYRFNVFRMSADGVVGQEFRPSDLADLLKLTRVIAAVLAEDGCLPAVRRQELQRIEGLIDQITDCVTD